MRPDNDLQKEKTDVFVARQPIFNPNQSVYGYELLYRSNRDNFFDRTVNQDFASSKTLVDSFLLFEINELIREKKAFINLTRKNLLIDYVSALPKGIVVAELLETIEPDPETIRTCRQLKERGYVLALDDFVFQERYRPLIDVADIIKVDFMETPSAERREIIKQVNNHHIKFLAEKVETHDDFAEALDAGYTYFQGYFFSKPVIVSRKDLPSYKPNLLVLLKELINPELNLTKIESIMKRDLALSYKLLRFINSAAFGFFSTIRSIRHAINLIGVNEFKKWMSVIVMSQLGSDKPDELVQQSVIRAKFCELVADQTPLLERKSDAFLMGMFSMIDTMIGRDMAEILSQLPLAPDIKAALLGIKNRFHQILELSKAYQLAAWPLVTQKSKEIDFPVEMLPSFYMQAIKWANCIETG